MRLLVARHAPVDARGLCYGQSDVPTTLNDDAACDALLASLGASAATVARVWSSPWARARGPAARLAARLGAPHAIDARLSELAFGAWELRPYSELDADPAFAAWMADWERAAPPGGERLAELLARVAAWHAEASACHGPDDVVLAVTHAGVVRALRAAARGVPYAAVVNEPVAHLAFEPIA